MSVSHRAKIIYVGIRKPGTVDEIHKASFKTRKEVVDFVKDCVSKWPKEYHFNYQKIASETEWDRYTRKDTNRIDPKTYIWVGTDYNNRGPNDGYAEGYIKPLILDETVISGRSTPLSTVDDDKSSSETYEAYSKYRDLLEEYKQWRESDAPEDIKKSQMEHLDTDLRQCVWLYYHQLNVIKRLREHCTVALFDDEPDSPLATLLKTKPRLNDDLHYASRQINCNYQDNYWSLPICVLDELENLLWRLESLRVVKKVPLAYRRLNKSGTGEVYDKMPAATIFKWDEIKANTVDLDLLTVVL